MNYSLGACAWLFVAALFAGGCKMTDSTDKNPPATEPTASLPEWRKMWNFGDPAETEVNFRSAIEAGLAAGDQEYVRVVTTQLARTQGMQRKFDAGHAILDGIRVDLSSASTEVHMRYLLERGRLLNSSGKPEDSVPVFQEAWAMGQGVGLDPLTADAGHMLGIALKGDAALEWAQLTMTFCEASTDKRCKGWLGPLYNNTGWTLHDKGELEGALKLWQKSLNFRQVEGDANTIFISRWTIARCYRSMGRLDEALAEQLSLHRDRAATGDPGAGYIEEELGEIYLVLNNPKEARPWFAKAFEMLGQDKWLQAEEPERLARMEQLGSE
ncbi:MAG: tetratricopeptide repeat protein [Planctomycetes bacterium]|nr:tetratricopeptide repeat protein [Planctomycetota bacterium]